MPIKRPTPIARPPRISILSMLFMALVFRNLALMRPRINRLVREAITESIIAVFVLIMKMKGESGIRPRIM